MSSDGSDGSDGSVGRMLGAGRGGDLCGLATGRLVRRGHVVKREAHRQGVRAVRASVAAGGVVDVFHRLHERILPFNRFIVQQLNERPDPIEYVSVRVLDLDGLRRCGSCGRMTAGSAAGRSEARLAAYMVWPDIRLARLAMIQSVPQPMMSRSSAENRISCKSSRCCFARSMCRKKRKCTTT